MIKSMTGFGRGEYADEFRTVTAEIKAVNHRYSDITVKMSRRYAFAEEAIKAVVKSYTTRGKIDVIINVDTTNADDNDVQLNLPLAARYYENLKALKEALPDLHGEITLPMVANMPDVMKSAAKAEDEELLLKELTEAVKAACVRFDEMRTVEGGKLIEDILMRNDLIEQTRCEIEEYAPQVAQNYFNKIKERIAELIGDNAVIPEDRIVLEAAVFADKSNITEELVRLKSHVQQLKKIAAAGEPAGKKLDFLVQEMNRESNTIGSKANDINITNRVLILKAEIEKIREQVQNIE